MLCKIYSAVKENNLIYPPGSYAKTLTKSDQIFSLTLIVEHQ